MITWFWMGLMETGEVHAIWYRIHCMGTDTCWWLIACIFFTGAWGCWSDTKLLYCATSRGSRSDVSHKRHNWYALDAECCATNICYVPTSIGIYEWNMLTLLPSGNSYISAFHFLHVMFADAKRATGQRFRTSIRVLLLYYFSGPVMCQLLGNKSPTLSSCGCRLNSLLCVVAAWTACCASNLKLWARTEKDLLIVS